MSSVAHRAPCRRVGTKRHSALCRPQAASRRRWRDSGSTPEVARESPEVATKGSAERKVLSLAFLPGRSVLTRRNRLAFLKKHDGITLTGPSGSSGTRPGRRARWERKEAGLSQALIRSRCGAERAGAESFWLLASSFLHRGGQKGRKLRRRWGTRDRW